MTLLPPAMIRSADISECGAYRYRLALLWSEGQTCTFIMLNPSTADAFKDDPTIRRCIGFARREGFGSLVVVNLFAFRATSPVDMKKAADPVGPGNDEHLIKAMVYSDGPVIAAWGSHGGFLDRAAAVRHMTDIPLFCLGKTVKGMHPKHPLYLSAAAPLKPF